MMMSDPLRANPTFTQMAPNGYVAASNPVPDAAVDKLKKWLVANGANLSRALTVTVKPGLVAADTIQRSGMGLAAAVPIPLGTELVSLPLSCQLRWVKKQEACSAIQWRVQSVAARVVPPDLWDMRFTILVHAALFGSLKDFGAWVDVLPEPPDTPLFWKAGRLKEVGERFPNLSSEVLGKAQLLKKMSTALQAGGAIPQEELKLLGPVSVRSLAKAYAVVSSRVLGPRAAARFCPLVDFATHSFTPNCEVKIESEGARKGHVRLVATNNIAAGSGLFCSYGPYTNQQLLLDYGFIVNSNPHGDA